MPTSVPNVEKLQRQWRREAFFKKHQDIPLDVGDIPYGSSLGRETYSQKVKDFRSRKDLYAFCMLHPKIHRAILQDIPTLAWFSKLPAIQTQFYQGVISDTVKSRLINSSPGGENVCVYNSQCSLSLPICSSGHTALHWCLGFADYKCFVSGELTRHFITDSSTLMLFYQSVGSPLT